MVEGSLGWERKGSQKGRIVGFGGNGGIVIRGKEKLGWKDKRTTKGGFSWRKIEFIMRSGAEGKQKPRKMTYPIRRGASTIHRLVG